ncbi:MAG: hypothetical protein H0U67_04140, partial [Gemmatimonadetes bacterium]|nr:hypothetical protein [Gemmatimonadota bacterium]
MHVPPKMPDAAAASPAGTWAAEVEALPPSTLHTLARWALGEWKPWISDEHDEHPLPAGIIAAGPAQIIDHTIEHHPESLAARFWKATRDLEGAPDLATARQILNQEFLTDPDWRRGWAIAALRALDLRSTWDSDGILLGLEYARNRLSHPDTVAMILLQSKLAQEEALDQPLLVQYSPFAEPEVQAVLSRLDQIVAAQERQPDRPAQVLSDVQSQGPHAAALLQEAAARHLQPGFELQGRAGSTVAFLLRALMEDAETGQQFNKVHQLKTYVLVSAARYGTTADWLAAAHRCTATQARLQPTEKVRMM